MKFIDDTFQVTRWHIQNEIFRALKSFINCQKGHFLDMVGWVTTLRCQTFAFATNLNALLYCTKFFLKVTLMYESSDDF